MESSIQKKRCYGCKNPKPITEFHKLSSSKDGLAKICKLCAIAKSKSHYEKNKESKIAQAKARYTENIVQIHSYKREHYRKKRLTYRGAFIKRKFNLSLDEYEKILAKQNECCKICNLPASNFNIRLAIDHDHESGKIRGLLCSSCNLLLGHAKDNTEILEKAIQYLKDTKKSEN